MSMKWPCGELQLPEGRGGRGGRHPQQPGGAPNEKHRAVKPPRNHLRNEGQA